MTSRPRHLPFTASALFLAALAACSTAPPPHPAAPVPPAAATAPAAPAGPAGPAAAVQWNHEWARGAVFYEVFVRSFADSNGDGIGDLRGLVQKLDVLNDGNPATTSDLGVDALWLMPVFASPSYHGYDTTDYDTINPEYGTNADFETLCREAHRRGIRIVLDLVVNHTSSRHPWFLDSASGPGAAHRDWYLWRRDDPGWRQPWGNDPTWHRRGDSFYYGIFWSGMPDLNLENPAVRTEMKRVAKLWLDRGADGFRLDAARHLIEGPNGEQFDTPATHAFWTDFSAFVRGLRPDTVLIGESWTDTARIAAYFGRTDVVKGGDQLPLNFDFPLGAAIVDGVKDGNAAGIAGVLEDVRDDYPPGVIDAPFLTNHDMIRIATHLGGDTAKLKSAAAILLTLPGAPFVYYGEELGMQNGPGRQDEAKRTPLPWDATPGGGFTTGTPWYAFAPGRETANVAAETGDPRSLLSRYRELIRLRHASDALSKGTLELLTSSKLDAPVLAFVRRSAKEAVLVLHNVTAAESRVTGLAVPLPSEAPLFADTNSGTGSGPGTPQADGTTWSVTLPAHGTAIFRIP